MYTWGNVEYSKFMLGFLQALEPRFYNAMDYILYEEDEVNECIFVLTKDNGIHQTASSGNYCIGFRDRQSDERFFHIKLGAKTIIGGYEN